MELYSEGKDYKLYHGSMLDMLEVIESNSIDSIITVPPYELNFMGKSWDNTGIAFQKETWQKCFSVIKRGGYLLAFGGTRTFHRIACAIEDAGFEIRDCIMYLYGSGFPKGMNLGLAIDKRNGVESEVIGIGKSGSPDTHTRCMDSITKNGKEVFGGKYEIKQAQNEWQGWNTQLKPAYEPIILAQKPVENSIIDNVLKYGVGGLNIDECRVGNETITQLQKDMGVYHGNKMGAGHHTQMNGITTETIGRYPANVIHDGSEEVCGGMPSSDRPNGNITKEYKINNQVYGEYGYCHTWDAYQDSGSASRYFYCAKASKKDRDEGLDDFEEKEFKSALNAKNGTGERLDGGKTPIRRNTHTTVKPTQLMQYLIRLVSPKGATILDCFNGSGSTGKAVMFENKERDAHYKYIGIELTEEYLPISKARIEYVINNDFDFWKDENGKTQYEKVNKDISQITLFDFLGGRA